MTPLTTKPTVVIRINPVTMAVVDVATNVDPELKIVVVTTATAYEAEACNKPFDTLRPVTKEVGTW